MTICPADFDAYVPSFDKADVLQSLNKGGHYHVEAVFALRCELKLLAVALDPLFSFQRFYALLRLALIRLALLVEPAEPYGNAGD